MAGAVAPTFTLDELITGWFGTIGQPGSLLRQEGVAVHRQKNAITTSEDTASWAPEILVASEHLLKEVGCFLFG